MPSPEISRCDLSSDRQQSHQLYCRKCRNDLTAGCIGLIRCDGLNQCAFVFGEILCTQTTFADRARTLVLKLGVIKAQQH